ncbi:MAG: STAS domain-containing protein [Fibrobacter sp.]|nr:STAS domain-containing protein [Fibrobacter sp.]
MAELKNFREVGVFDLLSAPLNPIGAFDAEQFKKDARTLIDNNPNDKFVAVDLMGLDFVYSDAYNAFLQFQHELSGKGGMLVLLTNSSSITDGLRKAGLDRKLKVFSAEAEMMAFSLHSHSPQEEAPAEAPAMVDEPASAPVASQNVRTLLDGSLDDRRSERKTGHQRRFTKSFNAITKDEKKLAKQGMTMPFDEEKSSSGTVIGIIIALIVVGGLVAFLLMR